MCRTVSKSQISSPLSGRDVGFDLLTHRGFDGDLTPVHLLRNVLLEVDDQQTSSSFLGEHNWPASPTGVAGQETKEI